MQIFIKNLSGSTITLEVEPSDTVVSVMQLLRYKHGVHMAPGRLLTKGKDITPIITLEDGTHLYWSDETWPHKDKSLEDWGVIKDDTLHIIVCNLRG